MYLLMTIDDDVTFSAVLKDFLESKGYMVEQVFNSIDATSAAQRLQPCLIILDMIMPDAYGTAVYLTLQKDSFTKNIPVIFLSSADTEIIDSAVPKSEKVRILKKTADFSILEKNIHELLNDK